MGGSAALRIIYAHGFVTEKIFLFDALGGLQETSATEPNMATQGGSSSSSSMQADDRVRGGRWRARKDERRRESRRRP